MSKAAQIKKLLCLPNPEIAKRVGVSIAHVRTERWRLNNADRVNRRKRELYHQKDRFSETREQIIARAKDRCAQVDALLNKGMTYAAIAAELGLKSRNVVAGLAHRSAKEAAQ